MYNKIVILQIESKDSEILRIIIIYREFQSL